MSDLVEMSPIEMTRVLWEHSWDAPAEWAAAIRRLADLSDEQIGDLPTAPDSDREADRDRRQGA